MATSIFLARLIGPVMLVIGIGLFVNREGFRAMAEDVLASRAMLFMSGLLTMLGGLAIVLSHNIWAGDWRILLTLLGWLATFGGAFRILAPQLVMQWGGRAMRNNMMPMVAGGIWLVAGLVLCFFGYFR